MDGVLTSAIALRLVEGCLRAARKRGLRVAAAVVDSGGNLLAFLRDEQTYLGAVQAAQGKAVTANAFQRPTAEMQLRLAEGKLSYLALEGALPMEGGVPLSLGTQPVGGLGVSGAPSKIDHEIATAIAASLATGNANV